jgi:tRNA1(Val) A37 N6-methylase TrmN6
MRPRFPLFSNPIDLAHQFWEQLLQKDDLVIDATCGNGKDSLAIALMLLHRGGGALLCLDLQKTAIDHTQKLLQEQAARFFPHVSFFQQSHETFPAMIQKGSVKLIVYNLGYFSSLSLALPRRCSKHHLLSRPCRRSQRANQARRSLVLFRPKILEFFRSLLAQSRIFPQFIYYSKNNLIK